MKKIFLIIALTGTMSSDMLGITWIHWLKKQFPNLVGSEETTGNTLNTTDDSSYDLIGVVEGKIETDSIENYIPCITTNNNINSSTTKIKSPAWTNVAQMILGVAAEYYALPKKYYIPAIAGLIYIRSLAGGSKINVLVNGATCFCIGKSAMWAAKKYLFSKQ